MTASSNVGIETTSISSAASCAASKSPAGDRKYLGPLLFGCGDLLLDPADGLDGAVTADASRPRYLETVREIVGRQPVVDGHANIVPAEGPPIWPVSIVTSGSRARAAFFSSISIPMIG